MASKTYEVSEEWESTRGWWEGASYGFDTLEDALVKYHNTDIEQVWRVEKACHGGGTLGRSIRKVLYELRLDDEGEVEEGCELLSEEFYDWSELPEELRLDR